MKGIAARKVNTVQVGWSGDDEGAVQANIVQVGRTVVIQNVPSFEQHFETLPAQSLVSEPGAAASSAPSVQLSEPEVGSSALKVPLSNKFELLHAHKEELHSDIQRAFDLEKILPLVLALMI